jgi:hypothetical protein
MRLISLLSLLFILTACGPEVPAQDDDTKTSTTAETPETTPANALTESTAPTDGRALEAKPRPRIVNVETQADPAQAQPRPTVPPNVLLEKTSQQKLPKPKKSKGLSVTEGPSISTPTEPIVEEGPMVEEPAKTTPDHSAWDALLRNSVSSSGQVNYRSLKGNVAALDSYLEELQQYAPRSDWSKNEIMAYWINAYNAYTVKLILNNYPVNSIKDIDGGNPWATKWIKIGGNTYSLNQIENDILRARYGDARIHFAVNCAAASCPPLHNRSFTADNLNSTLQRLTRSFINNPNYNTLSSERIEVSKIFDWYAADFGAVKDYINGYTDTSITSDTELAYKEYDWGLNGK